MNPEKPGAIRLVEAPTGTGKSLGYLIPGILASRSRSLPLVVSTGTVALLEQILAKGLPFIAQALNIPITFSLAKGRGRYFCERVRWKTPRRKAGETPFRGSERKRVASQERFFRRWPAKC